MSSIEDVELAINGSCMLESAIASAGQAGCSPLRQTFCTGVPLLVVRSESSAIGDGYCGVYPPPEAIASLETTALITYVRLDHCVISRLASGLTL